MAPLVPDCTPVGNGDGTGSTASVAAVNDCANGLGFAGRLKFSEVEPLRAVGAELFPPPVKLNDGVLVAFGGGAAFAFDVASEVVVAAAVGASVAKLGAAFGCVAPSSGFVNGANGVLDALGGSGSVF